MPGAAPFEGTHGSVRVDALLLEEAGDGECQMPP
jgi:hypothetical protein